MKCFDSTLLKRPENNQGCSQLMSVIEEEGDSYLEVHYLPQMNNNAAISPGMCSVRRVFSKSSKLRRATLQPVISDMAADRKRIFKDQRKHFSHRRYKLSLLYAFTCL
ncbi:hypothetical protein E2C01_049899 [Portunus trituberculatus]|uniref:Uncharacterized protein n=1 Tax=Portunus trituberculatus TaxID=210409 RepID=A0A5B7G7L1_PORTR|nr:hypothetical protein [Portunus trituberculatus]